MSKSLNVVQGIHKFIFSLLIRKLGLNWNKNTKYKKILSIFSEHRILEGYCEKLCSKLFTKFPWNLYSYFTLGVFYKKLVRALESTRSSSSFRQQKMFQSSGFLKLSPVKQNLFTWRRLNLLKELKLRRLRRRLRIRVKELWAGSATWWVS